MENQASQWELYKLLKEEYKHYLDQAENLWRTKFIAIGAFISLAILNEKLIEILKTQPDKANEVTALGILIIPMLAFVIDLKILETGFHLKNISNYIEKHFSELSLAQGWERENWGNNRITLFRKWITLFLSVGISLIILNFCLIIVSTYIQTSWARGCIWLGIIMDICMLTVAVFVSRNLYNRPNGQNQKKTSNPT